MQKSDEFFAEHSDRARVDESKEFLTELSDPARADESDLNGGDRLEVLRFMPQLR